MPLGILANGCCKEFIDNKLSTEIDWIAETAAFVGGEESYIEQRCQAWESTLFDMPDQGSDADGQCFNMAKDCSNQMSWCGQNSYDLVTCVIDIVNCEIPKQLL